MTSQSYRRTDRIARLVARRKQITPELPLVGMEVLGRARRLTLLSRPKIEVVFATHGLDTGEFDVLTTLRRMDREGDGSLSQQEMTRATDDSRIHPLYPYGPRSF